MGCLSDYNQEILDIHNEKRALHNSPPLKINSQLNKIAEEYAKAIADKKSFLGNEYKNLFLGENIYIIKEGSFNNKIICNDWYNEINKYDKKLNKYQKNACHFTQMIWKGTKEFGFGKIKKNGFCYAVALYYPPGNTIGDFENNVFIPVN